MSTDPDTAAACPTEGLKHTIETGVSGDRPNDELSEKKRKKTPRNVSFPEEDQLVTQYFEPANPWHNVPMTSRAQLAAEYLEACRRHDTQPIDTVLQQIRELPESAIGGSTRAGRLALSACALLGAAPADALEALLRKVQFKKVEIDHVAIDDEGAEALFDMIEYYESANVVCISGPRQFGIRGWQAASRMIKKSAELSELEVSSSALEAMHAPVLARSLKPMTCRLRALCLQRCVLCGEPLTCLVIALKMNSSIRELRLGDNCLSVSDAQQLGSLLRFNTRIQLLDLSNNQIQDAGVGHLAEALAEQGARSPPSAAASPVSPHPLHHHYPCGYDSRGLAFLILWNNQLTRNCAVHLSKALRSSQSLCVLNIGRNAVGGETVRALQGCAGGPLVSLGLQAARLGPDAARALADLIRADTNLQRLDLRDNKLGSAGLQAILAAMKENHTLTQIDLDDPTECATLSEEWSGLGTVTREIRAMCARNEPAAPPDHPAHRKISLTCHTALLPRGGSLMEEERRSRLRSPALSPAPSPAPSPAGSPVPNTHSRFSVTRVTPERESSTDISSPGTPTRPTHCPTQSRFKVVQVAEPPQVHIQPAPSNQARRSTSRFSVTRNYDSVYNTGPSPPPGPTVGTVGPPVAAAGPQDATKTLPSTTVPQIVTSGLPPESCGPQIIISGLPPSRGGPKHVASGTQAMNEPQPAASGPSIAASVPQITIGSATTLSGPQTASSGPLAAANKPPTAVIGPLNAASGPSTAAIGPSTATSGPPTTASGPASAASGPPTVAIGHSTAASGPPTTASRLPTAASPPSTAAIGPSTAASGPPTTASGLPTAAIGPSTAASGPPNAATGPVTVFGSSTTGTSGLPITASGPLNSASGHPSAAIAPLAVASGPLTADSGPPDTAGGPPTVVSSLPSATTVPLTVVSGYSTVMSEVEIDPSTDGAQIITSSLPPTEGGPKPDLISPQAAPTEPSRCRPQPEMVGPTTPILTKYTVPDLRTLATSASKRPTTTSAIGSGPPIATILEELPQKSETLRPSIAPSPMTVTQSDSTVTLVPENTSIVPKFISGPAASISETVPRSVTSEIVSELSKQELPVNVTANVTVSCLTRPVIQAESTPRPEITVSNLTVTPEPEAVKDSDSEIKSESKTEQISDQCDAKYKSDLKYESERENVNKGEMYSDIVKKNNYKDKSEHLTHNEEVSVKGDDKIVKTETKLVKNSVEMNEKEKVDVQVEVTVKKESLQTPAKVHCDQNVEFINIDNVNVIRKDATAMKQIKAITEDLGNLIREFKDLSTKTAVLTKKDVKFRSDCTQTDIDVNSKLDTLNDVPVNLIRDSIVLKKNKSESSLDSPDLEVSRFMNKKLVGSPFCDSSSSLEISGSSMESLNMDNQHNVMRISKPIIIQESVESDTELDRRKDDHVMLSTESSIESNTSEVTPVTSGNFLNTSVSSNESVSPIIFGKTKKIHDSLSSLEASVSSLDSGRQEKIMVTSADSGIEYSLQNPSENKDDNSSNEGTLTNNSSLKETVKKPEGFALHETLTSSPKRTSSLLDVPALKSKGLDRMRKISWVAQSPSFHIPRPEPEKIEVKPSHLDKLLSLFQHPSSIFSRSSQGEEERKSASNTPPRKDSSLTSSFWSWGSVTDKLEKEEKEDRDSPSEATDSTLSERVQVSFVDESFSKKLDSKTPSTDTDNTLSEFQSFPTQGNSESDASQIVERRDSVERRDRVTDITTDDNLVQKYLDLSVKNMDNASSNGNRDAPRASDNIDLMKPNDLNKNLCDTGDSNKNPGQTIPDKANDVKIDVKLDDVKPIEPVRPRSFAAVLKSSGSENSLDKQNSPDNGQPVDKLPSKVIRGIKENISPENTLTSSMTNTKALAYELAERQVKNQPIVNTVWVTVPLLEKTEHKLDEVKTHSDLAPIATIEETSDEAADNNIQLLDYIDDVQVDDKNVSMDSDVTSLEGVSEEIKKVETKLTATTTKDLDNVDLGKDALSYLIYENQGCTEPVMEDAAQASLAQELKDAEIKEMLDLSPELVIDEAIEVPEVFVATELKGIKTSPVIPERAKLKKSNSLEDISQLKVETEKTSPRTKTIAFKVPESTTSPRDIPKRSKLRTRSGSSPKSLPESLNKPCPLTKMDTILTRKKKKGVSSLGKIARDSLLALNMSEEEIAEFRRSYKLTSVESLKSLESVSEDANSQSGNSIDFRCRACMTTSQESLVSFDSITEDCQCDKPGHSAR